MWRVCRASCFHAVRLNGSAPQTMLRLSGSNHGAFSPLASSVFDSQVRLFSAKKLQQPKKKAGGEKAKTPQQARGKTVAKGEEDVGDVPKMDATMTEDLLPVTAQEAEQQTVSTILDMFPTLRFRPPHSLSSDQVESILTSSNTLNHTEADIGRYFTFSAEEYGKWFPEGALGHIQEEWSMTNKHSWMVRKQGLELVQHMKDTLQAKSADPAAPLATRPVTYLDGARGVGKSCILQYAVLWARQNDWLVTYVPRAGAWTLDPNVVIRADTGMFVQPELAVQYLQSMIAANRDKLSQLKVNMDQYGRFEVSGQWHHIVKSNFEALVQRNKEILKSKGFAQAVIDRVPSPSIHSMQTRLSAPENLLQIAEFGVSDQSFAVQAARELLHQLYFVRDVPVLIAVDQANYFYRLSDYLSLEFERTSRSLVPPRHISLCNAFMDFDSHKLVNGMKIMARSETNPRKPFEKMDIPQECVMPITPYSMDETKNCVTYYQYSQLLDTVVDPMDIARVHVSNQGNPLGVLQTARVIV